jgi:hypothetical protein
MAARIRKGDRVVVIAGADKGKRGEVTQVMPKLNRAVVEGVAVAVKHQKPSGMGQQGGLIRRERPEKRSADPGGVPDSGGRPQGPRRPEDRRCHRKLRRQG